jgi:hypothetical protein
MDWYYTQIKWIDPNGYGIISEYHYKGATWETAQKKAVSKFESDSKKLYGKTWKQDVEIRKIDSDKLIPGLHNQRRWGNPR